MLAECDMNGKFEEDEDHHTNAAAETSNDSSSGGEEIVLVVENESNMKDKGSQIGDDEYIEQLTELKTKAEHEVLKLKNEVERLNKTNSSMVMKYANSEREVLRHLKEIENANKQIKNLMKETESLNKKNKMLSSERERLIIMVDAKVCEVQSVQKEYERLKDDLISKDFKIKWTQNKLLAESEEHQETKLLLSKCQEELAESRNEASKMRKDCQEMIAACSPEPGSVAEDTIKLIESDNEKSDTENTETIQLLNPFQKEIETLKGKHKSLIEENNSLSCKVQSLQQERLDMEQKVIRLQESNADHLHQIATLQSDLSIADSLRIQLNSEQERITTVLAECDQLRRCNADLLVDMGLCRKKEAELLTYTQQVTEKNVTLQSEFSSIESKSLVLEVENASLQTTIQSLQEQLKSFERVINLEKKGYSHEKQSILDQMESQRGVVVVLQKQLDEARGEILMLKKKHGASLRELTKELHTAWKLAKEGNPSSDGISQSSRTSSSTSLNNVEATALKKEKLAEINGDSKDHDWDHPIIPDQQVLVERIVKLQRTLAKRQEKIEFLQEHERLLMLDLQRKSKVIQAYAMIQEPGALSNDMSDKNKQALGKQLMAEVVKHGGIMASVYGSKQADNGMTLELSLEINKKLQVVLEDTLLKNITLKNNINTLGEEIEKLTDSNRKYVGKLESKPS